MYLDHWRLDHSPFSTKLDPERLYSSDALEEAVARIEYLVAERRQVGVLLGERGLGKTATLAVAQRQLAERGVVTCAVDAFGLTRRELLWQVAEGLQASPDPADDETRLWRRLTDIVRHNKWQNRDTLLLVDDADQLAADLMRPLVRLLRLDSEPDARWTVVLATDPDKLHRLDEAVLHAIDLRVDLYAWSLDDTTGYVQNALVDAGRVTALFSEAAIERLHALTSGVPRHVVRLADFALVAGAGASASEIVAPLVDQAFEEISWAPPAGVS